MNGSSVGKLSRAASGALTFRYSEEWLANADALPISLALPLSPDSYSGPVVSNYFDNLLPDNQDLRRRMQVSLDADSDQPFDLLASAGADCVGAIQLFSSPEMPDVRRIDANPISDAEIARLLRDHHAHPLGMAPEEDDFRLSVAGAQEKTAFLWYRDAWHRPHRATPTTHLFKLPIGMIPANGMDLRDSVENEWLCLRILRAFGLPVPNAEIRDFEDVRVLVVERFDRQWSSDHRWLLRLPQEDACQALGIPPARKYEDRGGPGIEKIMDLLLQSEQPIDDRRVFLRAAILYWLLAAIDGHAKNFSFFLLPGGRCRLTPLYDVISAYPVVARGQMEARKVKMAMAVEGRSRHYRWHEIQGRHWLTTAKKCRFSTREAENLLEEYRVRIDVVADEVSSQLPEEFPAPIFESIAHGLREVRKKLEVPT
jgi:serine/threonine-protein kinase HipA